MAAPRSGSVIELRASASYRALGDIRSKTVYSNTVLSTVKAVPGVRLTGNHPMKTRAGMQASLPHTLTNTGNVEGRYRFTLDTIGCSPQELPLPSAALYLDTNGNGLVDRADVLIRANTSDRVTIIAGGQTSLLVGGIPAAQADAATYCVRLGVWDDTFDLKAFQVDRLSLTAAGLLRLTHTLDRLQTAPPKAMELQFSVMAENIGEQDVLPARVAANGTPILLDGVPTALVLLHLPVPERWQYRGAAVLGVQSPAQLLFRLRGDAPFRFRSQLPTDADVEEVALGFSAGLPAGGTLGFSFDAQLLDAALVQISSEAQAQFSDGVAVTSVRSNAARFDTGPRISLALAATAPVANVDADGRADGTATVQFRLFAQSYHHQFLYDVGIVDALQNAVSGWGTYVADEVPGPGQYTIVANSLRVVERTGDGTTVTLNPGYTGAAGADALLGPGSALAPGGSIALQFAVRFHLQELPPLLFNRARMHAAQVPGAGVSVEVLSINGQVAEPTQQRAAPTHGYETPFSARPPILQLEQEASPPRPVQGQPGSYDLDYLLRVTNNGPVDVDYLRVLNNLNCTFRMDDPDGPVAQWELIGAPKSDGGGLEPAATFTGIGPCDTAGATHLDPLLGHRLSPGLALVDGPVVLPAGASDTVRFTVRVTLKAAHIGHPRAFDNHFGVGVMEILSTLPRSQIPNRNDGRMALRWQNAVQRSTGISVSTGVVYHALTRQPVQGARVTMTRTSCEGSDVTPIVSAQLAASAEGFEFHPDGTVSTRTDAAGRYSFALAPQGSPGMCAYALNVDPPAGSGLRYPSQTIAAKAGVFSTCGPVASSMEAPQMGADTAYHTAFVQGVDAAAGTACAFYANHVPLDPANTQGLSLQKEALGDSVELGDALRYRLTLRNFTGQALPAVTVADQLPVGLRYVLGSATMAGQTVSDPAGGTTRELSFTLPAMAAGATASLEYAVRVGVGARPGVDVVNRAWATVGVGASQVQSNEAVARVRVLGGVFSDDAYAFGKVFMDCNSNGLQDPGEMGIPNVRLFLEDGTGVLTDSEGKWSLYGLRPLTHVLRLDASTLPSGTYPLVTDARQMGQADSQYLDLKNGEWRKANFAIQNCQAPPDAPVPPSSLPMPEFHADVVTGALPALEDAVIGQRPELGFLDLQDGQELLGPIRNVRIKARLGTRVAFSLNGERVDAARVGAQVQQEAQNIAAWEYIAVPFRPGLNTLLLQEEDAFGNLRATQEIRVYAPGSLTRVLLELPATASADMRTEVPVVLRLQDAAGMVWRERTFVTLEVEGARWNAVDLNPLEPGVQIAVENGSARVGLTPPDQPGAAHLRASTASLTGDADIVFLPDLRPLTGIGVLEGVLKFNGNSGIALEGAGADSAFESELRTWSVAGQSLEDFRGRSAFYFRGAVRGSYLMTLAYDSDKQAGAPLFRDIEPDKYYPIYGDSAERQFDAQSSQRLYLRVDSNRSYLLIGDYSVQGNDSRRLSQVARKATGVQHVYNHGASRVSSHLSQDNARQMVREFAANGTSGPFALDASGDVIANSETVEIIVRDRNQPNLILRTTPLTRFVNYSLNTLAGSILLTAPVATLDAELNPQSLRIRYATERGGAAFLAGGVAVQHDVSDTLQLGAVVEQDAAPGDASGMQALTLVKKLDANTVLSSEVVATDTDEKGKGQAMGVKLDHASEGLDYQVVLHTSNAGFDNPAAAVVAGQTDLVARMKYAVRPDMHIKADLRQTDADPRADGGNPSLSGGSVLVVNTVSPMVTTEIGLHAGTADASAASYFDYGAVSSEWSRHVPSTARAAPNGLQSYTSAGWRVVLKPPQVSGLQLYVDGEQGLDDTERQRVATGANYALSAKTRLYGRYEVVSSLGNPSALGQGVQRNVGIVGIDSSYMEGGRAYEEMRLSDAMDGRSLQSAMGVRNSAEVSERLRVTGGVEQVRAWTGGSSVGASDAKVATAALDWLGAGAMRDTLRGSASVELRDATDSLSRLHTVTAAYKLGADWSLLARLAHNRSEGRLNSSVTWQGRDQLGLAYRPLAHDRWNALLRYERRRDGYWGGSATHRPGRHSDIVSAHGNYQPGRRDQVSARLATRTSLDPSLPYRARYTASLLHGRWTRQLRTHWDFGLQAGHWFDDRGTVQRTVGAELGYQLLAGLWLSLGYNAIGLRDAELAAADYTAEGAYVRLRFKFDERLFSTTSTGRGTAP